MITQFMERIVTSDVSVYEGFWQLDDDSESKDDVAQSDRNLFKWAFGETID